MKATIDFDETLYRRLKVEAARRGRTVRDLVAEGVRYVLDGETAAGRQPDEPSMSTEWRPAWFGQLRPWVADSVDHDMTAVRESIARGRSLRDRT